MPSRRTRLLLIGVLWLALLVGLSAAWWLLWVPHWRPPLDEGERYGIDVSSHQGDIHWGEVAGDGISFAYMKATEGGDFLDQRFEENWLEAGSAGVDRGAYHFFTLCRPGRVQAHNFLEVAEPTTNSLPPAVDLELSGNCSERPPSETVESELQDFIDIVEAAWQRKVILYVLDDWEKRYPTRSRLDQPLWVRNFLLRPSNNDWLIWQLHGYAHVEGIAGKVDLNVGR